MNAEFVALRERLAPESMEPKGSSLDEAAMAEAGRFLQRHAGFAEVLAIDMGDVGAEEIQAFQAQQVAILNDHSPADPPWFRQTMEELAQLTESLSAQTFVQGFLMVELIDTVLRHATAFYAQRDARELSAFSWMVDAKGQTRTRAERFWSGMVFPALRVRSRSDPLGYIPWGDYSHFAQFEAAGDTRNGQPRIDLGKILADHRFARSEDEPGLQLADMTVSAVTRALNRKLGESGWLEFAPLFILRRSADVMGGIQFSTLRTSPEQPDKLRRQNYHGWVQARLAARAQAMVPPEHKHRFSRDL